MNCAEFASAKHDLLDRMLPDAQARDALAHAAECVACAAELRDFESLRAALLACEKQEWLAASRVRVMAALLEAAACEGMEALPRDTGLTGPVLTLITADAIPGALAG
ncbi:MAG: hypothetical protein FJX75_03235, partial [Armatimonadetes bacterium]|nr:hypothetical protein [Armatimonadota bacterium]